MNVEGAAVERRLGRTIMPRFHAGFSLGTVLGAAVGALTVALGVSIAVHLLLMVIAVWAVVQLTSGRFLPRGRRAGAGARHRPAGRLAGLAGAAHADDRRHGAAPLAVTEGTANDWLAVALIDGYGVERWVGVVGFGLFVTSMTVGRIGARCCSTGTAGSPVLWSTMRGRRRRRPAHRVRRTPALVIVGVVALGRRCLARLPGRDERCRRRRGAAPARVSVVSTIAYTAFLAGPPLLGLLGDEVGTLHALLAVAVLLIPSALLVPSARPPRPATPDEV